MKKTGIALATFAGFERSLQGPSDQMLDRARLAREMCAAGNYEGARSAISDRWAGVGAEPDLSGLSRAAGAALLLRAGSLTGWLGAADEVPGAQETAKDLVTRARVIFEEDGDDAGVAEAEMETAYCYWREGAHDEARMTLAHARQRAASVGGDLLPKILIRAAMVERDDDRPAAALKLLGEAAAHVGEESEHYLQGALNNTLGTILYALLEAAWDEETSDRAITALTAASYHFGQSGHVAFRAGAENNLGLVLAAAGRHAEAHAHYDTARRLYVSIRDRTHAAQVDESAARSLIAAGKNSEAERKALTSGRALERAGMYALASASFTTRGVPLARLARHQEALAALEHAAALAAQVGDRSGEARAVLTHLEELSETMQPGQARALYLRADELIGGGAGTRDAVRLAALARRLIEQEERGQQSPAVAGNAFVHVSAAAARVLHAAGRAAVTVNSVLITGETGTGKEVLARIIHEQSGRAGNLVVVNCAAIPEGLAESLLFGHRRGSFTGADSDYAGAARESEGGTLFLDEVGELSPANQARLLRLVDTGEVFPVGATVPVRVDVRVVAATNRDLRAAVAGGAFRADLFYRLGVFQIDIPPLRSRPEDLRSLALRFIAAACRRAGREVVFTEDAFDWLARQPLHGNARELRALVERAVTMADGGEADARLLMELADARPAPAAGSWEGFKLKEETRRFEAELIRRALRDSGRNLTKAARLLGLNSTETLCAMLRQRHREIIVERDPPRTRRKSIIRTRAAATRQRH